MIRCGVDSPYRLMRQAAENFLRPHDAPRAHVFPRGNQTLGGGCFDNTLPGKINGPGRDGFRALSNVNTVCVHQTAVEYGVSAAQIAAENKAGLTQDPKRFALHHRFRKVPYHYVALRNGDLLINNHTNRYTYHGNGCNSFSVGYAVEGRFPGSTWDDFAIDTARKGFILAVSASRMDGADIRYVTAHRQWSGKREHDPGEQIWVDVVLPLLDTLDLQLSPEVDAKNGGLPLPPSWLRNVPSLYI